MINILLFTLLSGLTFTNPDTDPPCFSDLESIEQPVLFVDTLILFDPDTFAESCYLEQFYTKRNIADSVLMIKDVEVKLVFNGDCYSLMSVKAQRVPCDIN